MSNPTLPDRLLARSAEDDVERGKVCTPAGPLTRPPLRYHGAKWRLASWIIQHFPRHRIYVEPYGGGASVLLRKRRVYREVYNDLNDEVVAFFQVLRDPGMAAELERRVRLTPFSRLEFENAYTPTGDPLEKARRLVVRSFMGFGSAASNSEDPTCFRHSSGQGTSPGDVWAHWADHVRSFTSRLQGVVIEHLDALEAINDHDGADTLFYADPPYPLGTRTFKRGATGGCYAFEMTDDDHRALATALRDVTGFVVVSGYPCKLYDQELYPDWHRVERKALADGAEVRTEVLWLSPRTWAALGGRQERLEL